MVEKKGFAGGMQVLVEDDDALAMSTSALINVPYIRSASEVSSAMVIEETCFINYILSILLRSILVKPLERRPV